MMMGTITNCVEFVSGISIDMRFCDDTRLERFHSLSPQNGYYWYLKEKLINCKIFCDKRIKI